MASDWPEAISAGDRERWKGTSSFCGSRGRKRSLTFLLLMSSGK